MIDQPSRKSVFFVLVLFALAASVTPALAQKQNEFEAKHTKLAAGNPEGVIFTVQVRNAQKVFRQGEVIPLDLAFSSSVPDAFYMNSSSYDRGGRLNMDSFILDPQIGASDPLEVFSLLRGLSFGGGIYSYPSLEKKPFIIQADLNEWIRFDRPGKYRLYVSSPRIARGRPLGHSTQLTVTSNMIDLQIVTAEPVWAKETLKRATDVLDSNDATSDRRTSCRVLRFLDTEGAAIEMAKRFDNVGFGNNCEFELDFGLRSTTHRAIAIAEMEKGLNSSQKPVTAQFLQVLSFLAFVEQNPDPRPPHPESSDQTGIASWRKDTERRMGLYEGIYNGYVMKLAAVVASRDRSARAISLDTLLESGTTTSRSKQTNEPERLQGQMAESLISAFTDLPSDIQLRLVESGWPLIKGPAMVPVLREILQNRPNSRSELPGRALGRLYELSPDEARPMMLEEMQKPHPTVRIETFALLKDETLPEVDALLTAKHEKMSEYEEELRLQLAERFATRAISSDLKSAYEEQIGTLACGHQSALLGYFLRVEPEYGVEMTEKALSSRKATHCYASLLTELAPHHMSPGLERIAIKSLDDPDFELVANAAVMLRLHGSATARDPLIRRLERLNGERTPSERKTADQVDSDWVHSPFRLEMQLVQSLLLSPAWLPDKELLDQLRQLCLAKQCKGEVDSAAKAGTRITVFFSSTGAYATQASLAQYNDLSWQQLKSKVQQFPRGTGFTWDSTLPGTTEEDRAFSELKALIETSGMTLTKSEK